jgi:hypothetical protein
MARYFANEIGFFLDAENQRVGVSNWFKAIKLTVCKWLKPLRYGFGQLRVLRPLWQVFEDRHGQAESAIGVKI